MRDSKIILFGATGDLARAKILPAFSSIGVEPILYGRKDSDLPRYIKGELNEISDKIKDIGITHTYLSLPPMYISDALREIAKLKDVPRIAIEKPFGTSLTAANELIKLIKELNIENKVYLVDHYLGKPALIDLLGMSADARNDLFNENTISQIDVIALETNNVSNRGAFYDSVGTIKDFVQSHIFAIVSTLLMKGECKNSFSECRTNVLSKIVYKTNSIILGQYLGFKETNGVSPDSKTETYVSLDLTYDNLFDIRVKVGKAMNELRTEVIISYKDGSERKFNIQSPANSYTEILKDFMSDQSRFSLSYNEVMQCWKITEEILAAKNFAALAIYPQASSPDDIH